jgi:hypothetical protein
MGIEEMLLEQAQKKGLEKGIAKGKAGVVKNLIIKMGLSDIQIAEIAEVPTDIVKKIREKKGFKV